jgi:hypothetical protein
MKRLIIAAFLLLPLSKPVQAVELHMVYFPLVSVSPVAVIDCIDDNGRFVECVE